MRRLFDWDAEETRAVMLLVFVTLATAFPFLQRAYFVDDYYHVTMARGLLSHPLRPYDFKADDEGHQNVAWERGQAPRMVNPPVFHYFLALAMKVFGSESRHLRAATLLFPLVSVICLYFLGSRFVERPFAAALLAALTPAYWLTSYGLMLDSAMLAFLLACLLSFLCALEDRSVGWAVVSGIFMGLTILSKYVGALVVPLCLLIQVQDSEWRRWRKGYIAFAVGIGLLMLWGIWNIATYGQMHLLATLHRGFHATNGWGLLMLALLAGGLFFYHGDFLQKARTPFVLWAGALFCLCLGWIFTRDTTSWLSRFYLDKLIVVGSFAAGTFIFPLASFVIAWDFRKTVFTWILSAALLSSVFLARFGGFPISEGILLAALISGSMGFLVLVAATHHPMSDPDDRFLLFWIVVGVLELLVVMPWTAGRYFLLVLPPAVWLFGRLLERTRERSIWLITIAFTAFAGLTLAFVDFIQADAIIRLAETMEARRPQLQRLAPQDRFHWYYLGDTFSGSEAYLGPQGWENVFPTDRFKKGDLLLKPHYRLSSWWKVPEPKRFKPVFTVEMKGQPPVRVMDIPAGAGFYGSCWGPLPFVFTDHPVERFELFQVQ